jgi:Tfp pilus assembly protein PilW
LATNGRLWFLKGNIAFTLVEVLVAAAIGALVLTAIMTTYIFTARSFAHVSNYAKMHGDTRRILDLMGRDVRAASAVTTALSTNVALRVPTAFSNGSAVSNKTVSYWIQNGMVYRREVNTGTVTTMLATNVNSLTFSFYDSAGNPTSATGSVERIEAALQFRKRVLGKTNVVATTSARWEMRNK